MSSSNIKGKPMLYADLFKSRKTHIPAQAHDVFEGSSSSSSGDSSCSGLSTPFGSELSSSGAGSEGEAFMAELTRQMAECMLDDDHQEEEEESVVGSCVYEDFHEGSGAVNNYVMKQRYMDSVVNNFKNFRFLPSNPSYSGDLMPQIQLKNQPPVSKKKQGQRRDGHHHYVGSGMKAIFLGGNGSGNGSNTGTGVFLPRLPNDPTQVKKKSGCSTVLIPTRVLQALELHFNKFSGPDSAGSPPAGRGHTLKDSNGVLGHQSGGSEWEKWPENMAEEMHLPQEWTY